jgi:hypothetical protein
MLSILDVRRYIDRLSKKEQKGNIIDGDDFNIFANIAQSEHLDSVKRKADETSNILDSLSKFVYLYTANNDSNGHYNYPVSTGLVYLKLISAERAYGSEFKKCDILTGEEYAERNSNSLTLPTGKSPCVVYDQTGFKFYPETPASIRLMYYRKPLGLFLDWYVNANDEIIYLSVGGSHTLTTDEEYSDGTTTGTKTSKTVDFEWPDDSDRIAIANRILVKYGIPTTNNLAIELGSSEILKSEAKV